MGGTVSLSGVYGGEVDPMPMMEMFDRGMTMRMGQCHVKRWIDDILPLVMDDSDPLGTLDMTTHHLAAGPGAARLRDRPEAGLVHQGGSEPVTNQDSGRVIVIIGASSGIGRATAYLPASRGDRLVLAARSADTLEQARQECVGRGATEVIVVPTDVGDRDAVDALFDTAGIRFG